MIKYSNKVYYYFPLGGILSKKIIFKKLSNLLNKIKNNNYDYKNVAIHLDLAELEETSIINEFLFSFLITKFYMNDENIIYVPKDIEIYIEIPNCFENYFSKFGILNIFNYENISLSKIPDLDLPQSIIEFFSLMFGYKTNDKIQKFIKEQIGLEKFSFHQVIIFIKLFISQFNKFNGKFKFLSHGKDITVECIQEFIKFTKYFTSNCFTRLLNQKDIDKKNDYIDILSNIYDSDLKGTKFEIPFIFTTNKNKEYIAIKIPSNNSKSSKSEIYLSDLKKY